VLDLTGAAIATAETPQIENGTDHAAVFAKREAVPSISLPRQSTDVRHFAMDMGGSLVKIVYFSPDSEKSTGAQTYASPLMGGGRLHFRKFETSKLDQCMNFIEQKRLHLGAEGGKAVVKATGGGAFKNSKAFQNRFGIQLQKEDEMKCAVAGANFLLQTIRDEAFTFFEGQKDFVVHKDGVQGGDDLFPYLLVNIGSGVSIVKVDSDGFERVGGTNIGGGTFWGLCRLLTGLKDFDQMLACSAEGDNSKVDMLVGDIYGGRDYEKVGLSSSTIASSFGQVVMDEGCLEDYEKADITLSLLRMISYNISHIATMTAVKHGLKRIFFGGYFIRGHAYTMNTISFAVDYWSKGEMKAMFLRHEGFLGALGAFLQDAPVQALQSAPLEGAWIEKFIKCSMPPVRRSSIRHGAADQKRDMSTLVDTTNEDNMRSGGASSLAEATRKMVLNARAVATDEEGLGNEFGDIDWGDQMPTTISSTQTLTTKFDPSQNQLLGKAGLQVGVLHLVPTLKSFPLLRWPERYEPNLIDMLESREEREYWLDVLYRLSPSLVEKAVASEISLKGSGSDDHDDVSERGEAFRAVFAAHLDRLREEPAAYGRIGLSGLFEMREECLRAFGFKDAYFDVKQQENAAALAVLPDLLAELDAMEDEARLLALIEGVLAGNIFDWGSQSCVDLYRNGTILEIYRNARSSIARPWAVDCFDTLCSKLCGETGTNGDRNAAKGHEYHKALLFCDNSGADVVLGMIPFARELLRRGTHVCLVANTLPAINDVTAYEMREVVELAAQKCVILSSALSEDKSDKLESGKLTVCASGSGSPCIDFRRVSNELCEAADGVDLIVLEGMGRAVHTNYAATFQCDTLKLAMLKNPRLAERLFKGRIYDCICKFEKAEIHG